MTMYLPTSLLFGQIKAMPGILMCVIPEATGSVGAEITHTGCAEWQTQSRTDPAGLEVGSRCLRQLPGAAQAQDPPL